MRLLVIRNSSMGDVALTTPVLAGLIKQFPEAEVTFVTSKVFRPFFKSIGGVQLFFPDFKGKHKGTAGILRLYGDLKKQVNPDVLVDLHDVVRTKVLRYLFRISGVRVSVINKGRKEKSDLVTGRKKKYLEHTVMRYCDAFRKAGIALEPIKERTYAPSPESLERINSLLASDVKINIGVAPFAKHKLKMWPEEYMIRLLQLISGSCSCRFWLFGGKEDFRKLKVIGENIPSSAIASGQLELEDELTLMSRLDLMISMDSSNMHMAAMTGTKVISIWGGTDPMAGFGAWMQPDNFSIRIPVEELDCRPCTIYGKGETRNGFACMKRLTPEMVFERMQKLGVI